MTTADCKNTYLKPLKDMYSYNPTSLAERPHFTESMYCHEKSTLDGNYIY